MQSYTKPYIYTYIYIKEALNVGRQVPTGYIFRINMMTSSNGIIFRDTGHLCREFTGQRWIPRTKASDAELWCFLWSVLNKLWSKQWWGWWFETPCCPLWRHCNAETENSELDTLGTVRDQQRYALWVGSYHQCRYHQQKWRTLRAVGTNNPVFWRVY